MACLALLFDDELGPHAAAWRQLINHESSEKVISPNRAIVLKGNCYTFCSRLADESDQPLSLACAKARQGESRNDLAPLFYPSNELSAQSLLIRHHLLR